MNRTFLQLHPDDNVAVAARDVLPRTGIPDGNGSTEVLIPAGHKIALKRIDIQEPVFKYNQIIGFATETILPGQHVHTHNVSLRDFDRDYAFGADLIEPEAVKNQATFEGFVHADAVSEAGSLSAY